MNEAVNASHTMRSVDTYDYCTTCWTCSCHDVMDLAQECPGGTQDWRDS